ncbi:amino acid--tRNA ligase-related protein [Candidatus Vidania fulgoroideorum]
MFIYGRLLTKRSFGGIIFLTVIWSLLVFQVKVLKTDFGNFITAKRLSLGDIILLCFERSQFSHMSAFKVCKLVLDIKNLVFFPDKYHSVNNKLVAYTKAYMLYATNMQFKSELYIRFKLIQFVRLYMYDHGFLEVDTPIISSLPETAASVPFVTFHKALKKWMYLRISPELCLKQLLVSGFDAIFEIGKSFRNEFLSVRHYPEFTSFEFYKVGRNYLWGITFLVNLLQFLLLKLTALVNVATVKFDYFCKYGFDYLSLAEVIVKYTSFSMQQVLSINFMLLQLLEISFHCDLFKMTLTQLWLSYFENYIQAKVIYPTFVLYFPIQDSPLAKSKDMCVAERYELYISGVEVANGFTELNDAVEQQSRLMVQAARTLKPVNSVFIDSLMFGMPSATGCGIGIDRLLMVIFSKSNIRDVIVFPEIRG